MKNVKCIRNCKKTGLVDCVCGFDNLFTCKNCGIEHMHYYKDWLYSYEPPKFYICAFCKIETPIQKKAEQTKLL